MKPVESRSVSWWPVHEFVAALVAQANTTPPTAGTPAWCALADDDPRKLLAVAAAGEHHVLRVEIAQEAMAQAAKDISANAEYIVANHRITAHRQCGTSYVPRKRSA